MRTTHTYTLVVLLGISLAACASSPPIAPAPDTAPIVTAPPSSGDADASNKIEDDGPTEQEGGQDWGWQTREDLKLRFKLPAAWQTRDDDGLLFALPQPEDDAVIIFMAIEERNGEAINGALKRLDKVLPMTDVKYTRQQAKDVINGIEATLGEGHGKSVDFDAQFYFLIVLLDLGSQYTMVATYIEEDVFESRSLIFGEILKSIERLEED